MAASPPRLLVIDDDADLRLFLQDFLTEEGYRVDVGATMPEALALIDSHVYDLILTDLLTHSTADPLHSAIIVRERAYPTPVIALTAWGISQAQIAQADLARLVAKPFDLTNLLAEVGACLTRPWSAEQKRWAETIERYLAAFSAGDLDACVANCADNVRVVPSQQQELDALALPSMQGRAALRAHLERQRHVTPDNRIQEYALFPLPNGIAMRCMKSWQSANAVLGRVSQAITVMFVCDASGITEIRFRSLDVRESPLVTNPTAHTDGEERRSE
jgi:DNA-binding response OmpR family regulator